MAVIRMGSDGRSIVAGVLAIACAGTWGVCYVLPLPGARGAVPVIADEVEVSDAEAMAADLAEIMADAEDGTCGDSSLQEAAMAWLGNAQAMAAAGNVSTEAFAAMLEGAVSRLDWWLASCMSEHEAAACRRDCLGVLAMMLGACNRQPPCERGAIGGYVSCMRACGKLE